MSTEIIKTVYVERRPSCRNAMETVLKFQNADAFLKKGVLEIVQYYPDGNVRMYFPLGVLNYWEVDIRVKEGAE